MTVYKMLIDAVQSGKRFKIDLVEKDLWINKKLIVKKGVVVNENKELIASHDLDETFEYSPVLDEACWGVAELLYKKYKHSSPKKIVLGNQSYFKANELDELSDYDLAYGLDRNFAQAILEGYVLLASLSGWLKLENKDHWFHQGKQKEFVVLKEWL